MTMKNDSSSDEGLKWQQQLLQHESFPSSSTKASIQSVDNNPAGRRRLADWLPWKLFQEEMDPQRANHGWFIGKYARECLHILPKIPGKLEWPFRPVSVLEWHEVVVRSYIYIYISFVSSHHSKSILNDSNCVCVSSVFCTIIYEYD